MKHRAISLRQLSFVSLGVTQMLLLFSQCVMLSRWLTVGPDVSSKIPVRQRATFPCDDWWMGDSVFNEVIVT